MAFTAWRFHSHPPDVSPITNRIELLAALGKTTEQVKLLRAGDSTIRVSPAAAMQMVARGTFEGGSNGKRVKYIREISVRGKCNFKWTACYRTTSAAVLPPSVDYMNSRLTVREPKPRFASVRGPRGVISCSLEDLTAE